MKKVTFLFIFIFPLFYSVDAQWYNEKCGVTDIYHWTADEFECMWSSATRNAAGGAIAFGVGTACLVGGYYIWWNYGTWSSSTSTPGEDIGSVLTIAGFIIDLVSIPIMAVGFSRRSKLRRTPDLQSLDFGTLNISPTMNRNYFNNSYSFGITATLSF